MAHHEFTSIKNNNSKELYKKLTKWGAFDSNLTSRHWGSRYEEWTCSIKPVSSAIRIDNDRLWTHCPSNTQAMSGIRPVGTSPSSIISSLSLASNKPPVHSHFPQIRPLTPHKFLEHHPSSVHTNQDPKVRIIRQHQMGLSMYTYYVYL